jgi:hypothetical protein
MIGRDKILLPWKLGINETSVSYRRYFMFCEMYIYIVKSSYVEEYYTNICMDLVNWGKSIEEAKDNVDKWLIKDGYILVPENKIDQYRLLG